ncbi:MAG: NADH-quinone oxidoreductase subunit N [Bryobacteraceae bacterium]
MPANLIPSAAELIRFLPEMILTAMGCLFLILEPFTGPRRDLYGHLTIGALIAAALAAVNANTFPGPAFGGMLMIGGFATFFRVLVYGVGVLTVLASYRFLKREEAETASYHGLLLYSIVGQSLMAAANELIMIFIGLEISSIASYVLTGYMRDDKRSTEAALKYFLLGSFATAFFLYGVAVVYGMTGSTNLTAIRMLFAGGRANMPAALFAGIAVALMFVGLGFKVSSAPFQIWAPDVYQGAPAPVAAFLSTGPKAAAFAVFLHIFMTAFQPLARTWEPVVWLAALASMTVGNFAALVQTNVKRMLAYSSIAHAGYVLVALAARSNPGTAAAMFYLAVYALMNVGAFAVVGHLAGKGERYQNVNDFAGLATRQPATAAVLAVFLLSLIGVPPTGGFFGKMLIFRAALDSQLVWLTIFGLLNSAAGAFYYLRLLVLMYMREPGDAADGVEPVSTALQASLVLTAAGTLALGVFPGWLVEFASRSAVLR